MILTSKEILKEIKLKNIIIEPFKKENLGTVSYHFHIGNEILVINNVENWENPEYKSIRIPPKGLVLYPSKLYLTHTLEKMGSRKYVQMIFGIRDIALLGTFIEISAHFGHLGSILNWTLEIKVVEPVKIYPFMKIGQITFWDIKGEKKSYTGIYNQRNKYLISQFILKRRKNNEGHHNRRG